MVSVSKLVYGSYEVKLEKAKQHCSAILHVCFVVIVEISR